MGSRKKTARHRIVQTNRRGRQVSTKLKLALALMFIGALYLVYKLFFETVEQNQFLLGDLDLAPQMSSATQQEAAELTQRVIKSVVVQRGLTHLTPQEIFSLKNKFIKKLKRYMPDIIVNFKLLSLVLNNPLNDFSIWLTVGEMGGYPPAVAFYYERENTIVDYHRFNIYSLISSQQFKLVMRNEFSHAVIAAVNHHRSNGKTSSDYALLPFLDENGLMIDEQQYQRFELALDQGIKRFETYARYRHQYPIGKDHALPHSLRTELAKGDKVFTKLVPFAKERHMTNAQFNNLRKKSLGGNRYRLNKGAYLPKTINRRFSETIAEPRQLKAFNHPEHDGKLVVTSFLLGNRHQQRIVAAMRFFKAEFESIVQGVGVYATHDLKFKKVELLSTIDQMGNKFKSVFFPEMCQYMNAYLGVESCAINRPSRPAANTRKSSL